MESDILVDIDLGDGLLPRRCQTITWLNAESPSFGTWGHISIKLYLNFKSLHSWKCILFRTQWVNDWFPRLTGQSAIDPLKPRKNGRYFAVIFVIIDRVCYICYNWPREKLIVFVISGCHVTLVTYQDIADAAFCCWCRVHFTNDFFLFSSNSMENSYHSLLWHHNGRNGVSNHKPHECLPNRLFGRRSKKTSKLRIIGLCAGNSPAAGEFPAQMASNAGNFSIWWRHHVVIPLLDAICRYNFCTCHMQKSTPISLSELGWKFHPNLISIKK